MNIGHTLLKFSRIPHIGLPCLNLWGSSGIALICIPDQLRPGRHISAHVKVNSEPML